MQRVLLATEIQEEEILEYAFEALNEIAKEGYDFIIQYIEQIGSATLRIINSQFTEPAMLAIEIWSTLAEVECQKN